MPDLVYARSAGGVPERYGGKSRISLCIILALVYLLSPARVSPVDGETTPAAGIGHPGGHAVRIGPSALRQVHGGPAAPASALPSQAYGRVPRCDIMSIPSCAPSPWPLTSRRPAPVADLVSRQLTRGTDIVYSWCG